MLITLSIIQPVTHQAWESAILELSDVQCTRGNRRLFSGLCARVQPGELLHVRGANGAGKTSLLRMMCGLSSPSAGTIRWQERNIRALGEEFSRQLLYIGHTPAGKADLSVQENLTIALTLNGVTAPGPAITSALEETGLAALRHTPARFLSQGQRRRLALSRLAFDPAPRLWILDEPFNALDTSAGAWLSARITRHVKEGGIAILTCHHEISLEGIPQRMLDLS